MDALSIPPKGEIDLLALGALVHRLDPGIVPFQAARQFDVHVSGGEYNVAADLSRCFGMRTAIASAMVKYPIGDIISAGVREQGVRSFYRYFQHDGATGPNMATVYSDRGYGPRAPVVFYNRANEAAAKLSPGDFNWTEIFSGGVRWFHTGGIFAALSDSTTALILDAVQYARKAGAVVSFDLNIRPKLWQMRGGMDEARDCLRSIVRAVDVLFGVDPLILDQPGFSTGESFRDTMKLIDQTLQDFSNLKVVAATRRELVSTNFQRWNAIAQINGKMFESPTRDIEVYDRIGSGDGFAAGMIYGLLNNLSGQRAVDLGWSLGALVASTPGDTALVTAEDVFQFAAGGSTAINR